MGTSDGSTHSLQPLSSARAQSAHRCANSGIGARRVPFRKPGARRLPVPGHRRPGTPPCLLAMSAPDPSFTFSPGLGWFRPDSLQRVRGGPLGAHEDNALNSARWSAPHAAVAYVCCCRQTNCHGLDPVAWTPRKRGCSSWDVHVGGLLLSTKTKP